MSVDPRAEVIAQHADYVSGGVRHCSCGLWSDDSPESQGTRIPFAHHVMARLALHGYVVDGPMTEPLHTNHEGEKP